MFRGDDLQNKLLQPSCQLGEAYLSEHIALIYVVWCESHVLHTSKSPRQSEPAVKRLAVLHEELT